MEHNQKIDDLLKQRFKEKVMNVKTDLGDVVIQVEKDTVKEVLEFLKKEPQDYAMLLDMTCVDYMGKKPRFEMVYHVFSLSKNLSAGVKMF